MKEKAIFPLFRKFWICYFVFTSKFWRDAMSHSCLWFLRPTRLLFDEQMVWTLLWTCAEELGFCSRWDSLVLWALSRHLELPIKTQLGLNCLQWNYYSSTGVQSFLTGLGSGVFFALVYPMWDLFYSSWDSSVLMTWKTKEKYHL